MASCRQGRQGSQKHREIHERGHVQVTSPEQHAPSSGDSPVASRQWHKQGRGQIQYAGNYLAGAMNSREEYTGGRSDCLDVQRLQDVLHGPATLLWPLARRTTPQEAGLPFNGAGRASLHVRIAEADAPCLRGVRMALSSITRRAWRPAPTRNSVAGLCYQEGARTAWSSLADCI